MLISGIADCQQHKVQPLAKTQTFAYNGKVIGGCEKSKLPDSVYHYLIIMNSKRYKDDQFVITVAAALADYGIKYDSSRDIGGYSYCIRRDIRKVIDSNFMSIWQRTKYMVSGDSDGN